MEDSDDMDGAASAVTVGTSGHDPGAAEPLPDSDTESWGKDLTIPMFDRSLLAVGDDDEEQLRKLNVEQYFTCKELDKMCDYEMMRYRKIYQNHLAMRHFGLNIGKPWFMKRHDKKSTKEKTPPRSSPNDEWTPQVEKQTSHKLRYKNPKPRPQRKKPRKQAVRTVEATAPAEEDPWLLMSPEEMAANLERLLEVLQPEPFEGFSPEEVDARVAEIDREMAQIQIKIDELEFADKEYLDHEDLVNPINERQFQKMIKISKEMERERQRKAAGRRYPKRNIKQKNYAELEVPDEDKFIFCDDCNVEYLGDCPEHGPLIVVKDRAAKDGDPERARNSVPEGLCIKKSSIPGAGDGVFSTRAYPKGVRFGPYDGDIVEDPAIALESGYCWQIYKDGQPSHYIDAASPARSNWMRFVNCACHEAQQNLVSFQFDGQIYYKTFRDIPADTELMVWYGDQYGVDLGILPTEKATEPTESIDEAAATATCPVHVSSPDQGSTELSTQNVSDQSVWICDDCNLHYGSELLYHKHRRLKHGVPLPLRICLQADKQKQDTSSCKVATLDQKKTLLKSVNNCNKSSWICKVCKISSASDLLYHRHMYSVHGVPLPVGIGDNVRNIKQSKKILAQLGNGNNENVKQSNGNFCKRSLPVSFETFAGSGALQTHIHGHTVEKPYVCPTCNKGFNVSSNLQTHIRTHTGEKPYVCTTCNKGFIQYGDLQKHIRTHTGEKPFVCPTCNKGFSRSDPLQTHIRTHTGEKPYVCPTCNKGFSQSCALQTHIRTHTGEKPYVCPTCNKGFSLSGYLQTHIRTHTGDKPFVCPTCNKGFIQSSDLQKHIRTHTGEKAYVCPTCNKGFSQSSNLQRHIRTHTGVKPYVCPTCNKGFSQSNDLQTHIRTHTGDKPYVCPTCNKGFSQSSDLQKHIRTHRA